MGTPLPLCVSCASGTSSSQEQYRRGRRAKTETARPSIAQKMEFALCMLGAHQSKQRRLSRKREREIAAPTAPPPDSPITSLPSAVNDESGETVFVIEKETRDLLSACVLDICDNMSSLRKGRSFVSRSVTGAFLAVQSTCPKPLSELWLGLLYVCFEIIYESYSIGSSTPKRVESIQTQVLTDMVQFLAVTTKPTSSPHTMSLNPLVKAARRWSRLENAALVEVVEQAWRIVELPKVRLALEAVLCNTAYGKFLF